jgi:acetolactate synthase-1/2/3 large subunit
MSDPLSRRDLLKLTAAGCLAALPTGPAAAGGHADAPGWVIGSMTGAQALVETLLAEGTEVVFGIPGAQENELWDAMKSKHLSYLLVTHEFSAATMADGYARATGKPGVICVVPGPGVTNALSGIGEALLDSIPMVCIVGDVACGDRYHAFQVHDLPQVHLLQPVTKGVICVSHAGEIPGAVRQAFALACCGEPGPAAVVVPYNLLMDSQKYSSPPLGHPGLPFDDGAFHKALGLLSDRKQRVGIYAGLGCMDHAAALVCAAELLQAPVATSISGKGVIPENHPLSVGWGYGPQGKHTAEQIFKKVDVVLAIGVRYSEVSTGFYSIPQHHVIQVDINPKNLGRVVRPDVCVHADAGMFLDQLQAHADVVRRPPDAKLVEQIHKLRCEDLQCYQEQYTACGTDPMALILALRRNTCADALLYVDVTLSQYWATEAFTTVLPRTFFNPTNNQAMGWSIPAALGGQRAFPGRQVVTITGDGCFLMSAMELATAARECLPVKVFVLDDDAYHYMQVLQQAAYKRTTATVLPRLDYAALAQGWGVGYHEINGNCNLDVEVRNVLCQPGPVLVRVVTDYTKRPVRWISAAKSRFTKELTTDQKVRFAARLASRQFDRKPQND